jgi:hypothetical protein
MVFRVNEAQTLVMENILAIYESTLGQVGDLRKLEIF